MEYTLVETRMKMQFTLLMTVLLLIGCGGGTARGRKEIKPTPPEPKNYTYVVRNQYPHLTTSFTQGLYWANDTMWEGTGEHGKSVLQTIDLQSGKAKVIARLPDSDFGEGIALLNGKIYQLTWQSNRAHIYNATTGAKISEMRYQGQGWGLTTDGQKLYMSDGSERIHTIDTATFRRQKSIEVTYKGRAVHYLNELEWIEGKIWANIYTTNQIAIIDPTTGHVEGLIDLEGLLPLSEQTDNTDVLNGIAYDQQTKRIFVTGKNWPKLYQIEIIEIQ